MENVAILICLISITANCSTATKHKCTLPNEIAFGTITNGNTSRMSPNEILTIQCADGFKAYPSDRIKCSEFASVAPKCLKTCPTVLATKTAQPMCRFNNMDTSCVTPYEDTVAIFRCNDHYENRAKDARIFTCRFGRWNAEPQYECEPACGLRNAHAQELLIGGGPTKKNEFPWHVAIFKSTRNICGGVIIASSIVLSAAHCFKPHYDPKAFMVAGGKSYREFSHPRDEHVQYRKIVNISIPAEYSADGDSRNDIAIVLLEYPFAINPYVLPACLDHNAHFNNDKLVDFNPGVVTGWGYTQRNDAPSDHLKLLEVNYRTRDMCTLRYDFKKYYYPYVHDKICAGHHKKNLSACRGDSGGGLTFQDDNGRYYVRGIVSITPTYEDGCDASQYTLYTSIAYHLPFILREMDKFEREKLTNQYMERNITNYEGGCIVPLLKGGAYFSIRTENGLEKAGQMIPTSTQIWPQCNTGHFLLSNDKLLTMMMCNQSTYFDLRGNKFSNFIECKQTCPRINRNVFHTECFHDGNEVDCDDLYDGMIVKVRCRDHYTRYSDSVDPYRYCIDGIWNDNFPECTPKCGKEFDDGVEIPKSDPFGGWRARFPWHVSIVHELDKKYICAGSLVTPEYVLTSECFLNQSMRGLRVLFSNEINYLEANKPSGYDLNRKGSEILYTLVIDYKHNMYAMRINAIYINHFLQPVCNTFRHTNLLDKRGYFINTEVRNRTLLSYETVPFHFREKRKCNANCANSGFECNFYCVQIIGKRTCAHIMGSGVIYCHPDEKRHYLLGIVDSQANCSAAYTVLRLAVNPEPQLDNMAAYLQPADLIHSIESVYD